MIGFLEAIWVAEQYEKGQRVYRNGFGIQHGVPKGVQAVQ